jgi:hypothetical protein
MFMAGNNVNNQTNSATTTESTLIAEYYPSTAQQRVRQQYGKDAIAGGTQLVDFNPRITFANGYVTVNAPNTSEVGGNPKTMLYRKIHNQFGDQIASDATNSVAVSRGTVHSSTNSGATGGYEGGAVATINVNSTTSPGLPKKLESQIQRAYDIAYCKRLIQFCQDNPNGVMLGEKGKSPVCYDKQMIAEISLKAKAKVNELSGKRVYDDVPNTTYPSRMGMDTPETPSINIASAKKDSGSNIESGKTEAGTKTDSIKTDVMANDFGKYGKHFETALIATNGDQKVAAEIVRSGANASLNPDAKLDVLTNKAGEFIPSQGVGMRGDPVNPANVMQSARETAVALNTPTNQPQITPTQQQVATVTEENPTQGGRTRSA